MAFGSSNFAITIIRVTDKVEVIFSQEYERPEYEVMVHLIHELQLKWHTCKVLLDGERTARRIIHDEFKINCEEQIRLFGDSYDYIVDGLVETKGKRVVLEFDGFWHETGLQKEKDRYRDFKLTEYGGYKVVRIPDYIIENDKSRFNTLILDAMFAKRGSKKTTLEYQTPVPNTPTLLSWK